MPDQIINNHYSPNANPDDFKAELLDIIAGGGDIDQVIKAGSRALGNPIHVLSVSEEIIARAGSAPESEVIWHMIENVGFPPLPGYKRAGKGFDDYARVYERLHHDHVDIRSSSKPRIMAAVGARSRVMGLNITHLNRFTGTIYVLETSRQFNKADGDLLTILAKAVSYLMMGDDFYSTMKGETHEYLLSQLLTRENISVEDIHDRISAVMPGLLPYMAILTVSCGESRDIKALRVCRSGIETMLPDCKTAIIGNQIVVLLHHSGRSPLAAECEPALEKLLLAGRLTAGLSNTFTDSAQIREAYFQGMRAIQYGHPVYPDKPLHRYLDYLPHHFLDTIPWRKNLSSICDPALIRIMQHDLTNKTEYTRTLNQYVLCTGNITEAARVLNIHYNTMKFRMGKISLFFAPGEICRNRLMLLFLSFRMLELQEGSLYRQSMGNPSPEGSI